MIIDNKLKVIILMVISLFPLIYLGWAQNQVNSYCQAWTAGKSACTLNSYYLEPISSIVLVLLSFVLFGFGVHLSIKNAKESVISNAQS